MSLEDKPELYIIQTYNLLQKLQFWSLLTKTIHYLLEITAIFIYLISVYLLYYYKSCNICFQILPDAIYLILNLKEQLRFLYKPNKIM